MESFVYAIEMPTEFRGITRREGMILRGAAGLGEWSPFWDYDDAESRPWWQAALEAAEQGFPAPVRHTVPVNVTIPAVSPADAHHRVLASGCATAKVKVAHYPLVSSSLRSRTLCSLQAPSVRRSLFGLRPVRLNRLGRMSKLALPLLNRLDSQPTAENDGAGTHSLRHPRPQVGDPVRPGRRPLGGQSTRERSDHHLADEARVEAVRDALGAAGKLRLDANGSWSVDEAFARIKAYAKYDLEYVEQPCASIDELAELRRKLARAGVNVRIAADESIRHSGDPLRVSRAEAADIAVLKVQPLGGVRRCLELAEQIGLSVVVSSALETSVGIRMGLALAAALPTLDFACGLNTVALLSHDVVTTPLVAEHGQLTLREVELAPGADWAADADTVTRWQQRRDRLSA